MEAEIALGLAKKRRAFLDGEIEDEKAPEVKPEVKPEVVPKKSKKGDKSIESDEINSNSKNNTIIDHLEDSMSAVDISAESISQISTPKCTKNVKIENSATEKADTKKTKFKKQTNIENF